VDKQIEEMIQSYVKVFHEPDWDATSKVFDKNKFATLNEIDEIAKKFSHAWPIDVTW